MRDDWPGLSKVSEVVKSETRLEELLASTA